MDNEIKARYFRDYIAKIEQKKEHEFASVFNSLIVFLNYCFLTRNNFFIESFNKRNIRVIMRAYNQLKSNILTPAIDSLFHNISLSELKCLRFIIISVLNNFEDIINKEQSIDIETELINEMELKTLVACFNQVINK